MNSLKLAYSALLIFTMSLTSFGQKEAFDNYYSALDKVRNNDLYGAMADFSKAIELKPDEASFYAARADAKYLLGDYYGGINDYNMAIQFEPNTGSWYSGRAELKYLNNDYYGAIEDYKLAIKYADDPVSFAFYLAKVLFEAGRYAEAVNYCNMHLERVPGDPTVVHLKLLSSLNANLLPEDTVCRELKNLLDKTSTMPNRNRIIQAGYLFNCKIDRSTSWTIPQGSEISFKDMGFIFNGIKYRATAVSNSGDTYTVVGPAGPNQFYSLYVDTERMYSDNNLMISFDPNTRFPDMESALAGSSGRIQNFYKK